MATDRRFLDRLFQLAAPGVVEEFRPAPARLADGVWSLGRHLRMTGGPALPSRTTIVRLQSGNLAVISPPPPHDETFAQIDALGHVDVIVAPNSFHYLYVSASITRYPRAALYLAPGLADRIASLPAGIDLGACPLRPDFEQVVLDAGRGISEVILFHPPSRILILSDCAFNLVNLEKTFDRLFWRAFGVPSEFGPSRTAKMMLLRSRENTRTALRQVLQWPFERILVAHGDIVQNHARGRFERAFADYL